MMLSATGDPIPTQSDPQVRVGVHLKVGTLLLTLDGTKYEPHHGLVEFAAPEGRPWTAEKAHFSANAPDGCLVSVEVDLLNEACDGPRPGIPEAIWKVVALAATSAGDAGITYTQPAV
ncbi:hypothetical protein ACFXHD_00580 [Streptomyces hydrogenans]|uniref:hypothetical protein n=1 Tax=Streptomyces hydrogenans TaxID=1873719 RepID=UPI0036B7779B